MCSCSTKGQASLVMEAEIEGEAEEEGAGVAEKKVAEAEVRGKCKHITTWPFH